MRDERLLRIVFERPWLITSGGHSIVAETVVAHAFWLERAPGVGMCGEMVPVAQMEINGPQAIIPIKGVIGKGLGAMERGWGATDIEDVANDFRQASADDSIEEIFLWIDSPGGVASGVFEFADELAASRKPVTAICDGDMCSAAYLVACAAESIVITPTATVGSIGVYMPFMDRTDEFAAMGRKVDLVTSGKYKGAGYPGTSLTLDQRANFQSQCDQLAEMFKTTVENHRFVARDSMHGQTFIGREALRVGLVDEVTNDIRQKLLSKQG